MQTLISYASFSPVSGDDVKGAIQRVESGYAARWPRGWLRRGYDSLAGGVHLWDVATGASGWPSWAEGDDDLAVASLYVPLGFQAVVGSADLHTAPIRLARRIAAHPETVVDLGPPFVIASADTAAGTFELFNDALGVARLFRVRTPKWTVWSNRPQALCLFAGVSPAVDLLGWRYHAGTDWFMGDTTPLEHLTAVRPGARVTYGPAPGPPKVSRLDPSMVLAAPAAVDADEVAKALRDVAVSVGRLWPAPLTVGLTGGRDSRVVAAAFISAGVDVRLHTHDAVPGEVEAAERLVSLLPAPPHHEVQRFWTVPTPGGSPGPPLVARVHAWHRYAEGLRPASYLWHSPPASLRPPTRPVVSGAAGELAHGHFYPPNIVSLEALPVTERLPAYRELLLRRLLPSAGLREETKREVCAQVDRVLREGWALGLVGGTLLDYFYVDERLRRWGTAAEGGFVAPLLTPAFVRAAFSLTAQQRLDAALHRDVLRRLMPQWADVPFFKAAAVGGPPRAPRRAGAAADHDDIAEIFLTPSRWDCEFDPQIVADIWQASLEKRTTAAQELLLARILWRDLFVDHLAAVNDDVAQPRTHHAPPATASAESAVDKLVRLTARTAAGRAARKTAVGRAVKALVRRQKQ